MIGIFDSGVGGLSIHQKIKEFYPDQNVIYLADQKNFPYGEKTEEELEAICTENIHFLEERGANLIVIACNSATVSTVKALREKFSIPIIGIEPAVKMAVECTKNGKIGLIATKRTVESHDGEKWLKKGQELYKSHQDKLVAMIENRFEDITDEYLEKSLAGLIEDGVDCVALGCTHYHFLTTRFKKLFPQIIFLSPEENVAKRVKDVVDVEGIKLENGSDVFYSTSDVKELDKFIKNILKIEKPNVREI